MIGCVSLNFEIISYKILLDLPYLSLGLSILLSYTKLGVTSVSKRRFFLSHIQRTANLQLFMSP
jgi:hypothetical protein